MNPLPSWYFLSKPSGLETEENGKNEKWKAAYIIKHVESLLDVDGHKFLVDL